MTEPFNMADELAALKADNARLRRLLDQAGTPDSLRHGLRNILAMLRTILRRSAENAEDVEGYAAHLEGRLSALTRVHAITDAFGEADLHTLIADELQSHLVREGEGATLDGPIVRLRPRAALVVTLALHELTSNAVEHGVLALPQGRVDVAWSLWPPQDSAGVPEPLLALAWKETGGSGVMQPSRRGFGTDVLQEMLAYDLKARTTLSYEPDGLRCVIHLPLADGVGRIIEEDASSAS